MSGYYFLLKALIYFQEIPTSSIREEHVSAAELRVLAIGNACKHFFKFYFYLTALSVSTTMFGGQMLADVLNSIHSQIRVLSAGQERLLAQLSKQIQDAAIQSSRRDAVQRNNSIVMTRNGLPVLQEGAKPHLSPFVKTVSPHP